jgi:hypothetical protein
MIFSTIMVFLHVFLSSTVAHSRCCVSHDEYKIENNDTANEANTIGYFVNPFLGVSYHPILICDNVAMVK